MKLKLTKSQRRRLAAILTSGGLLAALVLLRAFGCLPGAWYFRLPLFLVPYLIAGWSVLRRAFLNVFHGQLLDENFLMSIATVGALVLEEYPEAVFVMLFYQVGELFQSIAVGRSRDSITELMKISPDRARVERDGVETVLSPDEVAVGDVLIVRPGEKIPLDGVILEGQGDVNTVSLTGESAPAAVAPGDTVLSGCVNGAVLLRVRVTKPYSESTVAKILELVENSTLVKSRAEQAVTRFARWYTPSVVAGALLIALIPSLVTGDWQTWLRTALTFLVISCPCALVISVPLSYFGGLGSASRGGVLIKGANYLEALADADTVVFDKTGTLTEGSFAVAGVYPAEGFWQEELLLLAAAAEQNSNHPLARSLTDACRKTMHGWQIPAPDDVEELPGLGIRATVNGKTVLVGNARLMRQNAIPCDETERAGTQIYVAEDGRAAGMILISDRIKQTSAEAVRELTGCGVRRIVLLTGDREAVAADVAQTLGISEYRAGLLPADKVAEAEQLLADKRGTLIFVGDGVNDAPVLARSDVGIAMGALGSDAAIEAADVVLTDDDPARIPFVIRLSRFTRRIVRENIVFALTVKLAFLLLGVFHLTGIFAASFADVGVAVLAILNATRTLSRKV